MSATVTPRWNAATLMRPRQFGRDVDRQSRGEGAVLRGGERGCLERFDPAFDVAGTGGKLASARALRHSAPSVQNGRRVTTRSQTCAVACTSIAQPR